MSSTSDTSGIDAEPRRRKDGYDDRRESPSGVDDESARSPGGIGRRMPRISPTPSSTRISGASILTESSDCRRIVPRSTRGWCDPARRRPRAGQGRPCASTPTAPLASWRHGRPSTRWTLSAPTSGSRPLSYTAAPTSARPASTRASSLDEERSRWWCRTRSRSSSRSAVVSRCSARIRSRSRLRRAGSRSASTWRRAPAPWERCSSRGRRARRSPQTGEWMRRVRRRPTLIR